MKIGRIWSSHILVPYQGPPRSQQCHVAATNNCFDLSEIVLKFTQPREPCSKEMIIGGRPTNFASSSSLALVLDCHVLSGRPRFPSVNRPPISSLILATWAVNEALSVSEWSVLWGDMEMCFLPTISHSLPSFLSWVGKQVTIDGVSSDTRLRKDLFRHGWRTGTTKAHTT